MVWGGGGDLRHDPSLCRSCYMVFPALQLALALSCVMGLVMFARYCGESHKQDNLSREAVGFMFLRFLLSLYEPSASCFKDVRFFFSLSCFSAYFISGY